MIDPHINDDAAPELSVAGAARREAMLDGLIKEMTRVHARRKARRRAVIAAAPILLAAAAIFGALRMFAPAPRETIVRKIGPVSTGTERDVAIALDRPAAIIKVIHTDSPRQRDVAEIIPLSDDELLHTLAEMNRSTGLVRAGQRVWLTSAVADAASHGG